MMVETTWSELNVDFSDQTKPCELRSTPASSPDFEFISKILSRLLREVIMSKILASDYSEQVLEGINRSEDMPLFNSDALHQARDEAHEYATDSITEYFNKLKQEGYQLRAARLRAGMYNIEHLVIGHQLSNHGIEETLRIVEILEEYRDQYGLSTSGSRPLKIIDLRDQEEEWNELFIGDGFRTYSGGVHNGKLDYYTSQSGFRTLIGRTASYSPAEHLLVLSHVGNIRDREVCINPVISDRILRHELAHAVDRFANSNPGIEWFARMLEYSGKTEAFIQLTRSVKVSKELLLSLLNADTGSISSFSVPERYNLLGYFFHLLSSG